MAHNVGKATWLLKGIKSELQELNATIAANVKKERADGSATN